MMEFGMMIMAALYGASGMLYLLAHQPQDATACFSAAIMFAVVWLCILKEREGGTD